jgi:hypothetical protein
MKQNEQKQNAANQKNPNQKRNSTATGHTTPDTGKPENKKLKTSPAVTAALEGMTAKVQHPFAQQSPGA